MSNMKCTDCGSTMTKTVGDHVYRETGMDHVILRNITKYTCPEDGKVLVQIPSIGELHRTLALVVAAKPARLVASEVRFLRDHLELSNTQFADLMGVSPTQSSRWTTSEPIGPQAERFLRMIAILGPKRVRPIDVAPAQEPASSGEGVRDHADVAEQTLDELSKVIQQLPSLSSEVKSVKIRLRRGSAGWKQDAATSN